MTKQNPGTTEEEHTKALETYDIIIIGWGASGLMSAALISEWLDQTNRDSFTVCLIERNKEVGKKIKISWGGRCNFTTGKEDKKAILGSYPRWSHFLKAGMGKYPPKKIRQLFERWWVPSKIERDGRVFPMSDKSDDIIQALRRPSQERVNTYFIQDSITHISQRGDGMYALSGLHASYQARYLIIATWGSAYHHTGSTGDGYTFARSLGHQITPIAPSLSSLEVSKESLDMMRELQGYSYAETTLSVLWGEKRAHGWLIFTHFGISGPAVFALSAWYAYTEISMTSPMWCTITFGESDDLTARLQATMEKHPKKQFINTFMEVTGASERLISCMYKNCIHTGYTENTRIARSTREEWLNIWKKWIAVEIIKRRPGDEFVSAGWVDTKEISPESCESHLSPHLYFVGEIIDADGITGGFNFQNCWVTAHLASADILKKLT